MTSICFDLPVGNCCETAEGKDAIALTSTPARISLKKVPTLGVKGIL